jgi:RNA polymerase sigma-70 factor (ECF subfamily)
MMLTDEPGRDSSSDLQPIDVATWIEAARRGDREALGQALLSFRDYLLMVANEEIEPGLQAKGGASDLVQETFLRAQRRFEGFRGRSEAEWRNWLRSILVRHLANQRRRYYLTAKRRAQREVSLQPEMRLESASCGETPSRVLTRREREAAVIEAVARLPDHYREVVIWHNREKLAFEEIGRRRGISAEAARKLWARALGRLRDELGPVHDSQ